MRIAWIDHTKAMAIVLVVYGHSLSVDWGIDRWIYAFHLPLFFVISGYLGAKASQTMEFLPWLRRQCRSLLVPYFVFATIGYLAWLLVLRHVGDDAAAGVQTLWWQPTLATLYGTGSHATYTVMPEVLWFLPCLLVAQTLSYGLARLPAMGRWPLSIATATSAAYFIPAGVCLPFEIEQALVAQVFLLIGRELRSGSYIDRVAHPELWGGLALLAGSALAYVNEKVDMRVSDYGHFGAFLLTALLLSGGWILVLCRLPSHPISHRIAQHTIAIFPLHPLVFSGFSAAYVYALWQPLTIREHPVVGVIASLVNVALLALVIAPLIQRWVPWVYGTNTARHHGLREQRQKQTVPEKSTADTLP